MFSKLLAITLFLPLAFGGSGQRIERITFIGNSITQAGNMPAYGWYGYWGVAASQADKDYVHRVQLGVTARQGSIVEIQIINSDFHLIDTQTYTEVQRFAPDLIIVEMGDNAAWELPKSAYDDVYGTIRSAAPQTRIIATGLWHGAYNDVREERMRQAVAQNGMEFVPLADLDTETNQVRSEGRCENEGVCWHPGDRGMQAIAGRLLSVIYGEFSGTIPQK